MPSRAGAGLSVTGGDLFGPACAGFTSQWLIASRGSTPSSRNRFTLPAIAARGRCNCLAICEADELGPQGDQFAGFGFGPEHGDLDRDAPALVQCSPFAVPFWRPCSNLL